MRGGEVGALSACEMVGTPTVGGCDVLVEGGGVFGVWTANGAAHGVGAECVCGVVRACILPGIAGRRIERVSVEIEVLRKLLDALGNGDPALADRVDAFLDVVGVGEGCLGFQAQFRAKGMELAEIGVVDGCVDEAAVRAAVTVHPEIDECCKIAAVVDEVGCAGEAFFR